jgi:hypothetical protein
LGWLVPAAARTNVRHAWSSSPNVLSSVRVWYRLTRCHRLGAFEPIPSQRVMFRIEFELARAGSRSTNVRHAWSSSLNVLSSERVWYRLTRCHRLGAFELIRSQRVMFRIAFELARARRRTYKCASRLVVVTQCFVVGASLVSFNPLPSARRVWAHAFTACHVQDRV